MLKMKDKHYINNIAELRNKKDISQTQLANAIGVETSTISRIETGKSDPSAVTLFAIANVWKLRLMSCTRKRQQNRLSLKRSRNSLKEISDIILRSLQMVKNYRNEQIFEIWRIRYRMMMLFSI